MMSAAETIEYETILKIVRDWPPARRVTLMQEVLQTLAPAEAGASHQPTLARALACSPPTNRRPRTKRLRAGWTSGTVSGIPILTPRQFLDSIDTL
jgi:hypothetical protein